MAHEYEGGAVRSGVVKRGVARDLYGLGGDCLCDGLLVGVDDGGVGTYFTEKRLCDDHGLEAGSVLVDGFGEFVVLGSVHQVGGLDDEILDAVGCRSFEGLVHVVDEFAVAGLDVVDDDLGGEGSSYCPVGIGGLKGVLDSLDVGGSALVERGAEAHDEELVLSDIVGVPGIIQGSVAGVPAEVVGIGALALDQLLLGVGQGVPGLLCLGALVVGLVGPFLYVDRVDQGCYLVGGLLVLLAAVSAGCHAEDHADRHDQGDDLLRSVHLCFIPPNN